MKKRFLQKKPIDLSQVSSEELFTEVMKRVTMLEPSVCYFVDRVGSSRSGVWNIHAAMSRNIIETKELK